MQKPEIPSFHDGLLTGVLLEEGDAILRLRRTDNTDYKLTLTGIKALQIENLRERNIIYDVKVVSGSRPDGPDLEGRLERLFPSPHKNAAAQYHKIHAEFLAKVLHQIESGEAAFVTVESSFGCNLVAVCTGVVLSPLWQQKSD